LAATDEEIARLKQESEIEFRVLLAQKEAFEAVASRALTIIGAEAVPVLVEHLSHQRADIRQWAATVLGEIGADANEATPALIDALSDNDVGVREAARQSLDLIEAARRVDTENPTEPQAFVPGQNTPSD
jgi:HEAT repeat protein